MRNAGRKPRFSRNFACFRFPDAANGKKMSALKFLPFSTLWPSLPPFSIGKTIPALSDVPLASLVISSFSLLHFSQPVIPFLFLTTSPSPPSLSSKPISYPLSSITRANIYTRTYMYTRTHAYTLSTSIQFSLQVYVLIFTIIICGNV